MRSRLKKHWRLLAAVAIALTVARLAIPCPIGGNWVGKFTEHLCEDHSFLRFSDNRAAIYHGCVDPQFHGTFEKVGWNTYLLRFSKNDKRPRSLHVGWMFMHMSDHGASYWFYRDFRVLEAGRIVRAAQENALSAQERIHLLTPGMPAPEVWTSLGLSDYRTPNRSPYLTQDVYSATYLLSPSAVLRCDWDMTNKPPLLLKANFSGWP